MSPARADVACCLGALVTLFSLAGCSTTSPKVSLSPPAERIDESDYDRLLERWTRNARVIKQLDTTLRVHGTWFAPEFIAAYVAKRAHTFALPPQEAHKLTTQAMSEWATSYTFFVAAATLDYKENDFERRQSVWRISLVTERQRQVTPLSIEPQKPSATISDCFPYVGPFYRTYLVRFPRKLPDGGELIDSSTDKVVLRFAGPLGRAELVWQLL